LEEELSSQPPLEDKEIKIETRPPFEGGLRLRDAIQAG
jgi:hypothetical protein